MIVSQKNLKAFNTFGVSSIAESYVYMNTLEGVEAWLPDQKPNLILGGGSNLLLLDTIPGLTLHVGLSGIKVIDQQALRSSDRSPRIRVRVGAGVNWQQFVLYAIEREWHGLENLSLIPGTVGAAPVQNIGAYGVEVSEKIAAVHAIEYGKGPISFSPEECQFEYRDSLFKQNPDKYLITAVEFNLGGEYQPVTSYGAVAKKLESIGATQVPSPREVAHAIIEIRNAKLPSWTELGNAGSFFKNPIVSRTHFEEIVQKHPDALAYPTSAPALVKLPAGWLIDRAGWRGKKIGQVGCYRKQALVIVNHGGASGKDIHDFSQRVADDVEQDFGIELEREVRLIGEN